ncbi:SDR family NAD(P)-dependent oxidoreductase [Aureimonas leprariae]|uniref:SDR family oxidoreductase n=1 Tax=Plantimonas leprariae TaxID=2615207 RepID=A0A7V7PN58_9HYPH|nr:SDR family oxidoreductase [Aureimonas leprariae]KAB0679066.1 SDR family oxidoreductase [Aureimonas leprariae]
MTLEGRTILVTGASGGIGAAIVERIAAEGGRAVIHYGRDEARARALLESVGGSGWIVGADLSSPDGATKLWEDAVRQAGRVHGLVNNAGIRSETTIDDDLDAWQSAWRHEFQVDLFAAVDLCRSALRHFRQHGGGQMVHIASRAAQRGYAAEAMPYGAAKAALVNVSKSIARSFGKDGVTSVAIAPGWVRTAMAEDFVARFGEAAATGDIPTGAMATPEEVAELVAFALRPSQRSLNGATLDVNGGSYIR